MKRKLLLSSAVIPALLASGAMGQVVNFQDSDNGFGLSKAVGLAAGSYNELFAGQGAYADPGNDIWNGFGINDGYGSAYYYTASGGNWPYQAGNPGNPYAAYNNGSGWISSTGTNLFNVTPFGSGGSTTNGDADSSGLWTPIRLSVAGYTGDVTSEPNQSLIPNGAPAFLLSTAAFVVTNGLVSNEVFTLQNVPPGTYGLYLYGASPDNNSGTAFAVNSGSAHNGIAATLNSRNGSPPPTFIEGENFVIFENVTPDVRSNITITASFNPAAGVGHGELPGINVNGFQLIFKPPPTAVGSTAAQNVVAGSTANFLFSPAFATSPSFQWRSIIGGVTNKLTDGGNIAGATTTNLTIANVSLTNVGLYQCVISTATATNTSPAAPLTMLTNTATMPLQADDAISIVGNVLAPGDTLSDFNNTVGSPFNSVPPPFNMSVANVQDNTLFQYVNFGANGSTAPFSGPVGFSFTPSVGASVVTRIRFFTASSHPEDDPADYLLEGSNDGGTNFTPIAGGLLALPAQRNAAGGALNITNQVLREIDFANTNAYTTYQLAFTNVNDNDTASNGLQIAEVQVLGSLAPIAPSIVQQPAAAEILLTGTTLQASVVVKGAGPLNYSWYFNSSTPILNASNATLTVSNLGIANSGRYDCVISNPYGSITSSVLSLTVVASTTNPVVLTWADGTANMLWDWTSPNWLQGATTTNWHSAAGGIAHFGATGAGTVNLAASPPISVSSMTFDSEGYTLASNAMTLDGDSATITNNAETTVISNVLTGTSGLTIEGTGSLALGNVNTYSGGTIVNGGTLFANAGNTATGAVGGGNVTVNSGSTITVGGDNSFVGGATVASITITINAGGIVSDTNAIDSGDGSTCHLDALLLNGGTLAATTANDDWGNWDFDFGVSTPGNGSTSYISGGNAALTQGGGTVFNIGANDTVIVTTSLAHTTDAGDNGLIKTGSGTLTLNGDNTSTGGQFVNGGILNGNGDISGPVIVNAGGTLAAGTPSAIGQLTILSAPLTLNAGSTTMLRIDRTADTFDSIVSISALTYGGTLSVTNLAGTLAAGHSFPVFAADSYSGGSNDFSLPALAAGLSWDLSKLTANGSIAVVSGAAPLFFNPPAGSYILGAQTVTITCLTPGATIYYTTNGTTPTSASSSGLSPVTVIVPANTTMTIQAFGQATGYTATAVASATYTTASAAVWINPAGGSWETPSDWTNGIIPNQNGGTADFSQLTLTTNTYVTLDGTPTIGNLIFCDVGNKWTWEIDPGTGGPLTLAAGTNTPAITVKNQAATITAGIAGINGLSKDGTGTLALTFVNTYSGGTAVNAGTLFANAGNSGSGAVGSGNVTVNSGGTITVGGDNSFVGYGTSGSRTVTINAGGTISNTNTSDGGEAGSTCHLNALVMNGGTLVADIPNNTWGNWNFDYGVSTPGNGSSSFISGGNVALTEGGGTVFNIGANDTLTVSTALATVADLTDQGLIKTGSGTLTLNGDNTATANEIVNGGTLDGYGTISAPVIVNAGGTLGAGTPSAIGQLVIANTLTLNAGSITFLRIKPAAPENDSLTGISALTYGGTLTVTNLDGTLAAGDSFKLFSAASYNNNFTTLNLPALGSGLAWDWTPTSGTLAVVSSVPVPVLSGTVTLSGTSFSMSFTGVSGQGYAVLMTTNLILPLADWTSLTNGTFGSSPVDFTDPGATNEARFYRIKSP